MDPVALLSEPRVLLSFQPYVTEAGHPPPVHDTDGLKVVVVSTVTVAKEGLMDTDASAGVGVELMVMVAVPSLVTPFRVAFT